MAYMGRGNFPSLGGNANNNENTGNTRHYRRGFVRYHYYIPLDNTYVLFQMIATIIIILVSAIAFLTTYKPAVIDPAEDTKKIVIYSYLILSLVYLGITLLSNRLSKDKKGLIKKLVLIFVLSLVTLISFIVIKSNLNTEYTRNEFERIYNQEYKNANNKMLINVNGLKITNEKEFYIGECMSAYQVFTIRMYLAYGLNVLLMILLIFQIIKLCIMEEKKDKICKDDIVLFDEEENIKF